MAARAQTAKPAAAAAPEPRAAYEVELRPARIVAGPGRLAELGSLVREIGGRRALLVTDSGVRRAGHVAVALESLRRAGVPTVVFDEVAENPSSADVAAAADCGRRHAADVLVGIGGGSALDCTKGANFVMTNGGRMEDYWGWNKAPRAMLPSIGAPSTAGTGSEAQSFALISHAESHQKMACGDVKARFSAVVLDPLLPATAPPKVRAVTGFDALSHAVESFVSRDANPLSRLYAREAWRLLERRYPTAVGNGRKTPAAGGAATADDAVWGEMLLGSYLAGAAIEASMLGAAHACANPLTARFGVTHGVAVGLMLPAVVRANAGVAGHLYAELLPPGGGAAGGSDGEAAPGAGVTAAGAGEALACHLERLRAAGSLPDRLSSLGIGADALPSLAADAVEQWTLRHNPRQLTEAEVLALYRSVL